MLSSISESQHQDIGGSVFTFCLVPATKETFPFRVIVIVYVFRCLNVKHYLAFVTQDELEHSHCIYIVITLQQQQQQQLLQQQQQRLDEDKKSYTN